MATTTKGFPYPQGADAVDVAGDMQALAEAVDDMPGVQSYTGTEISNLTAGEKWAGRIVWNSTTGKLQVSNGSTFSDVDTTTALSTSTPSALGVAAAGSSTSASKGDHVHTLPTASDVGAVANSLVDAKGDLVTATANDTPAILTAGSNGQMLMADSSATAGLRYVDPPANRNLIINGAMSVAQRGTSVTGRTTGGYLTVDRYSQAISSAGTWTIDVQNDAPTGSGLRTSHRVLCTTAQASLSAGAFMHLNTSLEGQDLQRVKKGTASAEQLTLSFWVKSNVTGTYVVELTDNDNSRHAAATYSVSASGTWERKTITFAADTTGAFDNDNAASLTVQFWQAAGTNFTSGTLPTGWASSTTANRAVGQTNLAAATNNYWQITGVQLETGPVATPFEFEPYEATLRKCQRYYYRTGGDEVYPLVSDLGYGTSTTSAGIPLGFPTRMRVRPTAIGYSNLELVIPNVSNHAITDVALSGSESSSDRAIVTVTSSGLTANRMYWLRAANSTSGHLAFSAEL